MIETFLFKYVNGGLLFMINRNQSLNHKTPGHEPVMFQ